MTFNAKEFLSTLSMHPGVYCMLDKAGKVLYVGKAKKLKSRLASYFRTQTDERLRQLVSRIAQINVTITHNEKEALLLENSLIKSLKPRYNVIFRDDKSYPYLFLSQHPYPRLVYFRGTQKQPGKYFGPYPSGVAVRETLNILQKLFKLRQCDDQFFAHRARPCLQYQIQRCSAPCVGYVTPNEYAHQVEHAGLFLKGKETTVLQKLVALMEKAALNQEFEQAATLRDQIIHLRAIAEQQNVYKQKGNLDVLAACELKGQFCLQLLYIRQGRVLDSKNFSPTQTGGGTLAQLLRSFIIQFYLQENKWDHPDEIVLNHTIEDQQLIAHSLSQLIKRQIKISAPHRGEKAKWLKLAQENALQSLQRRLLQSGVMQKRWQELNKVVGMVLTKVECFDISHLQGEATIASCVVFDQNGPCKSAYRHYNLMVPKGDDYAAMEQVLLRRYAKCKAQGLPLPDMIMVDGGKGQLHRAKKALMECQILDMLLMGIAKGEGRKPGLETLYVTRSQSEQEYEIRLAPTSVAFHLLQQIRDEAHRFAIRSHRRKRQQARKHSPLEAIQGVGVKRRQRLLNYFGGQQALLAASIQAIAQVPGVSKVLASKIYQALHP